MKEKQKEINKTSEWNKAKTGTIIKFEESGDFLEGIFQDITESVMYPESYLVNVKKENGEIYGVFVNSIVKDLIEKNDIQKGNKIKIVYLGLQETQDKKFKYKNYEVYFKK